MERLVEARGIVKSYAGVPVLLGVSFDLAPGEIHALLGGNGAGKSTLMKILSGLVAPDRGEIRLCGSRLDHASPAEAQRLGLYLVPQEAQIFPNLTVLENIAMAMPKPAQSYQAEVARMVSDLGVHLPLDARASTLEIADRQIVEILRGMIRSARVLILDEPTSALTPIEVSVLFDRMRRLRATGVGLVFISHKLHELRAISDRITVLRDGEVVLSEAMASCTNAEILSAMSPGLGQTAAMPARIGTADAERLRVEGLAGEGFRDIDFSLGAGEILGLAGVIGAGRTELAETLFGLRPVRQGKVFLKKLETRHMSPREAVDGGLVLLSEDRQQHGLFLDAPLAWNVSAFLVHRLPWLLRPPEERRRFETFRQAMSIRCAGPDQSAGRLSGGNQQKVLLAKCLSCAPDVLILDEPTRGVDAGARKDIYDLIAGIVAKGTAILLISSDFEEITRLSHRIMVMAAGRIAGHLPAGAEPDQIAALAFESREVAHA